MPGQLFTHYFLTAGIKATAEWQSAAAAVTAFRSAVAPAYVPFTDGRQPPNEAVTEQELIRPILEALGWNHYLPQQGTGRNEDIPDYLLFTDPAAKDRAAARPRAEDRYQDATVVEESKRFGLALDARDEDASGQARTPHGQILRYLATADIASESAIRWGILTNGAKWRLYDYRARPRATGYYEADLAEIISGDDDDALRLFYLLFRRDSCTRQAGATTTFLEDALTEGRRYEEQVAQDLSGVVFEHVFPSLVQALANAAGAGVDLEQVREAALICLYRLLFVLYAEDRGLLPVNDARYADYGLRKPVREHIAQRMQQGTVFSTIAAGYYNHLLTMWRLIDQGDESIGLPPYNGGLFATDTAPLLEAVRLPDAQLAPIIYNLSHTETDGHRRFINYRDMSVQQLGSIYERLLEREPLRNDDGRVTIRPNPYARKDSGSFYTPQELVDLIVERTLQPLVEERLTQFEATAAALQRDRRPQAERLAELSRLDPATAVLDLKILDPAMGSGHFLVTAVDFLSDKIADLIETPPADLAWLPEPYISPLVKRVAAIRRDILKRAAESDWVLDTAQLTDQAIIRRMVLKRCIYGVDKNPLAVELAKVSLWLHSFTVGAPLSFLDHHLRCGDSLLGLTVWEAIGELNRLGGVFAGSAIAGAESATKTMQEIEALSDADIAEVRESALLFRGVEDTTEDLRGLLDFLSGLSWLTAGMKRKEQAAFEAPLGEALGSTADTYRLLARGPSDEAPAAAPPSPRGRGAGGEVRAPVPPPGGGTIGGPAFTKLWHSANTTADHEHFLHWEVAFPGVWHQWQDTRPQGGFDAVIGNPPWDRIKLQEVEWFATRSPALAQAPTAAARKRGIARLRDEDAPLAAAFDAAKARADTLGKLVRGSGHYPLLGGGDINLYSLFVERAMHLIKPDGLVGLLTPSGIYADKTAARFFKTVSTKGRVSGLFDFENRRLGTSLPPFFPDVDGRFKFVALIFGGEKRPFKQTDCAFFLSDTATIKNDRQRSFPLTQDDFTRVNPNTGTAPVFRTRRDADITRAIYQRHPVLVDRSDGQERKTWPVRYRTIFHMTNDSHLFRTAAQLEAAGFYPVQGNRWKRGDELYLPLYQGRMIWHFDHRANSVRVNPESTHNPYLSEEVSEAQHADPNYLPQTQYWVPAEDVELSLPQVRGWTLGFRNVAPPTNARTLVATIVPWTGFGNSVQLLVHHEDSINEHCMHLLAANLCSYALDFCIRQKVQGSNINWYIVEQLPVIAPADYDQPFGSTTARELVRDHVLRLTYTAHDLAPFARDLGYDGPPFHWDEEKRRHLRARLDALYFHLYGLSREDAAYILSTFPIVRREDEAQFCTYRTRDLILAYMHALAAGDTHTVVTV